MGPLPGGAGPPSAPRHRVGARPVHGWRGTGRRRRPGNAVPAQSRLAVLLVRFPPALSGGSGRVTRAGTVGVAGDVRMMTTNGDEQLPADAETVPIVDPSTTSVPAKGSVLAGTLTAV